jgi:hypothetical protein
MVRRGGLAAAEGPYPDDPSHDERPAGYDPNGEQLAMTEQHEPSIKRSERQGCGDHPHEDPQSEKDYSKDPLADSPAMSGPPPFLQKLKTSVPAEGHLSDQSQLGDGPSRGAAENASGHRRQFVRPFNDRLSVGVKTEIDP